jgi:hypothetical protein
VGSDKHAQDQQRLTLGERGAGCEPVQPLGLQPVSARLGKMLKGCWVALQPLLALRRRVNAHKTVGALPRGDELRAGLLAWAHFAGPLLAQSAGPHVADTHAVLPDDAAQ